MKQKLEWQVRVGIVPGTGGAGSKTKKRPSGRRWGPETEGRPTAKGSSCRCTFARVTANSWKALNAIVAQQTYSSAANSVRSSCTALGAERHYVPAVLSTGHTSETGLYWTLRMKNTTSFGGHPGALSPHAPCKITTTSP